VRVFGGVVGVAVPVGLLIAGDTREAFVFLAAGVFAAFDALSQRTRR
jgi:hypothetical protein